MDTAAPVASGLKGTIDLENLVWRMADRDRQRTEADVQSDLHAFLLAAPLDLDDHDVKDLDIALEQPAGARRRIDVEAGFCVFEVKKDLRKGNVRADAEVQLAGYVAARTQTMDQRYVGVLTDGADWILYHWDGTALREVSRFSSDPAKPDVEGLAVWLEGVLATGDAISPTPSEIGRRLGSSSPGHALDFAELLSLYDANRDVPTVRLKRELWSRLLATALGTGFSDSDDLFVDHTLLVATADIIAHAAIGLKPATLPAATILSGQQFIAAQIRGVVDSDFFDWLGEVPGGDRFVRGLARRLDRFAWHDVQHDVLKTLYESVIPAAQRKRLGEYYTPDWLADRVVEAAVSDPLGQRVLDPACGSGTFLFHAIRRYLDAADASGLDLKSTLTGLTRCVIGMDLHPVAVTLARVTYLLAIGPDRLGREDRPALSIPVYLGDSIQWGQEQTLFSGDQIVIPAIVGRGLLGLDELRFPQGMLADAARFDAMVAELSKKAGVDRLPGGPVPAIDSLLDRYGVPAGDRSVVAATFRTLCRLHDANSEKICGYYVLNLARPVWLARPENRVDVLVGNPPWLAYRFMTRAMQKEFRTLCERRGLWAGAAVATHQDLSALFVLQCVERYLKDGGRLAFVLPWSVLRGRQFAGFRTGAYQVPPTLAFGQAWDLKSVKPAFFPVPACVVHGTRAASPVPLSPDVEQWSGKLRQSNVSWAEAGPCIVRKAAVVTEAGDPDKGAGSPYRSRFFQGATLVPRMMFVVQEVPAGPLGAGAGRVAVESRRSANEKAPWKGLPTLRGNLEREFVRPLHLGETVLPYRTLPPLRAVVPWDGKKLLGSSTPDLGRYPALSEWWQNAEALWDEHSAGTMTLLERVNYQKTLSNQFPPAQYRVVYSASGMYLAAAVVDDFRVVVEHSLYWMNATSLDEARYLVAVLNSDALTQHVRPLQARGEHNPRHYDKYVWQAPIPTFNGADARHARLAELAARAETLAAEVELPPGRRFETLRRMVRDAVAGTDTGREIEEAVAALLSS